MILNAPNLVMPTDKDLKMMQREDSMSKLGIQLTEEESKVHMKVKQIGVPNHPNTKNKIIDKAELIAKKRKNDAREEDDCSYVSLSEDGDTNEQVSNQRHILSVPALKNAEPVKKLDFSMRNKHLSQIRFA